MSNRHMILDGRDSERLADLQRDCRRRAFSAEARRSNFLGMLAIPKNAEQIDSLSQRLECERKLLDEIESIGTEAAKIMTDFIPTYPMVPLVDQRQNIDSMET